jgi:hypothetical protein
MKALERNKKLYEALLQFTDYDIKPENLQAYFEKRKKLRDEKKITDRVLMEEMHFYDLLLTELKYIKPLNFKDTETQREILLMETTEKGWNFLESYETYIEKRKTNNYLLIFAIPAAIYYVLEIGKSIYYSFHIC